MADQSKTQEQKTKVPRHRSPAYPAISLRKALERARQFYAVQKQHPAPVEAAVGIWEFAAKSSGGAQTIAALKQYGLMSETDERGKRKVQLSERALRIIRDEREPSPERDEAIRQAALLPKIYAEMWDKWNVDLPADATMRLFLIHDKSYNEASVADLITTYKDTIALAKLAESDKEELVVGRVEKPGGEIKPAPAPPSPLGAKLMEGERIVFSHEIGPSQGVRVLASGEVSEAMLAALESYVKQHRSSFMKVNLEKLLNAGFVELQNRELWYSRDLRMAFSHQAIREMDPWWLDRHLAEKVGTEDFVFHFVKPPKDIQGCSKILEEIGLPKLRPNIRLATFVGQ